MRSDYLQTRRRLTKPQIETPALSRSPGQPTPAFDVDKFISEAPATKADGLARTKSTQRIITGRGKMPGPGIMRTSLDLPDELYELLKIAALKEWRTLREIILEGMQAWLQQEGYTRQMSAWTPIYIDTGKSRKGHAPRASWRGNGES